MDKCPKFGEQKSRGERLVRLPGAQTGDVGVETIIITWYLGSNQNEQLFAFIQVSDLSGSSRNMDAITRAHGAERKNVYSTLS